ncbi:APC family permease [Ktedonosporobacter rubrisoli]|uniref:APC family permease n=2 Tax=Ktedonosporobacter rubrisoli TaxID=2509675 RepID=A0A4P6K6P2_KTERU|nr:APC family permease [Ktedonosporobacter rubrisoli]
MEELRGRALGNLRVRVVIPKDREFKRVAAGELEATEAVEKPESNAERVWYYTKRFLLGVPIPTAMAENERISKFKALALLSSDAISSVAFATEAILINLAAAGSGNLGITLPISLVILFLLLVVATSYRQTIPAYPNGGGSYTVARENLGVLPGLVAAAALMIDYVLNVAVCIAAGVHNIISFFPSLNSYIVPMAIALIVIMMILNLRGLRESGTIFAFPTYFFIVSALLLIIVGLIKAYLFRHQPIIGAFTPAVQSIEPLTIIIVLRAFSTGCTAMTGVEAISNATPVFREPQTRNAAITLTWMACILGVLFLGITLLAMTYGIQANAASNPTVVAQIAMHVYEGPWAFLVPLFLLAVLGILTLSAETSFAGFPRLTALLAQDRFLPTQFSFRGDRLAFSVGIVVLAACACLLILGFGGNTDALINLFAVGVFIAFTLSQAGMVVHWWHLRGQQRGWQRSIIINGVGACTTAIVTLVVATMKFLDGAWIVVLLIPILVVTFVGIRRHYLRFERESTIDLPIHPRDIHHRLIVPIDKLNRASVQSLAYARSVSPHVTAVHIVMDTDKASTLREDWQRWQKRLGDEEETHLLIIDSPYRSLIRPLLAYIDTIHERHPQDTVSIVLPEFVVAHWWQHFLHNQTALRLKAALLFRPGIVVINLPQHLS